MERKETVPPECEVLPILVIDDDAGICNLLIEALSGEGRLVVAVPSAEEGLAQLPYHDFGLALVDHHLPRMDGLTLAGFLRRARPLLDVVLMTGEDGRWLRSQAQEEGIRFLSKPLALDEVNRLVGEAEEAACQRRRPPPPDDPTRRPRLDSPLLDELAGELGLPPLPERLREALVTRMRDSLTRLRSRNRYEEQDRLLLYCGIVAARLFGVSLPTVMDGRSIAEEYDRLMLHLGKQTEFTPAVEER